MTERRERSRREWEQGLADGQRNVTPADQIQASREFARRLGAVPPTITSLGRFAIGISVAIVVALIFGITTRAGAICSASGILVGFGIAASGMRWKDKRK